MLLNKYLLFSDTGICPLSSITIITLKMLNGPSFSSRIKRAYDKYQFVPDAEEQAEAQRNQADMSLWLRHENRCPWSHPHCLCSETRFITAQGAHIKSGVAKTLVVQRTRLIGEGVRGLAARVKHCRADDATKQQFLWQGVCSPSHREGEGAPLSGWCSAVQRLHIYNTFYIVRPLRW